MRKAFLIVGIMIVVVGIAIYLYPSQQSSQTIVQTPTSTPTTSSIPIHVLVNVVDMWNNIDLNTVTFSIKNATTGDVVSTKDKGIEAQNPSSYIYLNGKKIAETWGYSLVPTFSPNNKYFAVLQAMDEGCAGTCIAFYIPVINLSSGAMTPLYPQPTHYEFVESYSWVGDNAIDVISYPVSSSYRTTPKQVWQYDLTTGSSTLIQTIP